MTRQVGIAIGLWAVLGLAVFSVTFDWQTRTAGMAFTREQLRRYDLGQPVATIHEGFRPMVRSAAVRSSGWLGLILVTGVMATVAASRASKK